MLLLSVNSFSHKQFPLNPVNVVQMVLSFYFCPFVELFFLSLYCSNASGAFDDDDVTHVEGELNPVRDLDIISDELRLKDLELLNGAIEKMEKNVQRTNDKKLKAEYVSSTGPNVYNLVSPGFWVLVIGWEKLLLLLFFSSSFSTSGQEFSSFFLSFSSSFSSCYLFYLSFNVLVLPLPLPVT